MKALKETPIVSNLIKEKYVMYNAEGVYFFFSLREQLEGWGGWSNWGSQLKV